MRKPIFERLKEGLEEGVRYERGELELKSNSVEIPRPPREYEAEDIKDIRERLEMSQAQFAKFLFVSTKTVQGWEQGLRRPTSSAARLLQFIEEPELLNRSVG